MRRSLIAAVGFLLLAALPLAARAGGAPAITLLTPAANDVVVGEMSITWSYQAFSRSAWVDVEASRPGEPFQRVARVRIDDGTPGYTGSATWATGPEHDGSDWTIRVIVPSNKRVQSSVSPVVIDNAGPEATEAERSPAPNAAGWNNGDVTVKWLCTDRASGAVQGEVFATAVDEGTNQSVSATCTDLAGHSATATASGINIDRTLPSVMFSMENNSGVPNPNPLIRLAGWSQDGLSGVAGIVVTFVDEAGNATQRTASCPACGSTVAPWDVGTEELGPGIYQATATATDVAGNVTDSSTQSFFIVGTPTVPPVTVPTVEPSA